MSTDKQFTYRACDASVSRRSPRHVKRPVYWWADKIAQLQRTCPTLRRRAQRARREATSPYNRPKAMPPSGSSDKPLLGASPKVDLGKEVSRDSCGLGYKILTRKVGALLTCPMEVKTVDWIVDALLSTHPVRRDPNTGADIGNIPLFSQQGFLISVGSLQNNKVPGPDGVTGNILIVTDRV